MSVYPFFHYPHISSYWTTFYRFCFFLNTPQLVSHTLIVLSRVSYVRRWTTSLTCPIIARSLEALFCSILPFASHLPFYLCLEDLVFCVFALCHLGTGVLLHSLARRFFQ